MSLWVGYFKAFSIRDEAIPEAAPSSVPPARKVHCSYSCCTEVQVLVWWYLQAFTPQVPDFDLLSINGRRSSEQWGGPWSSYINQMVSCSTMQSHCLGLSLPFLPGQKNREVLISPQLTNSLLKICCRHHAHFSAPCFSLLCSRSPICICTFQPRNEDQKGCCDGQN